MQLGERRLTIEDVAHVARVGELVFFATVARARIAQGRARLEELLARGERIYGVNTGVGGNVGISLAPDQMELLQHNIMRAPVLRHRRSRCRGDVVRAATLLRIATFCDRRFGGAQRAVDALAGAA